LPVDVLPFPITERYNRYSRYLKEYFGTRVDRICVDAGFTCPTRDGKIGFGGCLYCDNASFAPARSRGLLPPHAQVQQFLQRPSAAEKRYLVYFQPYTNTYAPVEKLREIYTSVLTGPPIVGIIIGTRPDCLNAAVLDLLTEINQMTYVSIEIGIESVYDKNLAWAQRGHDFACAQAAIKEVASRGLHVAGHLILGFPGESRAEMLASATILSDLPLRALKIHHLHVVRGSRLAEYYAEQPFALFTEQQWVETVCDFLERLRPDIVIQRLVGEAQGDTLIAPQWQWSKGALLHAIQQELQQRNSYQGKYWRA
jgi:radical SAM protein (TIGR01212 family)